MPRSYLTYYYIILALVGYPAGSAISSAYVGSFAWLSSLIITPMFCCAAGTIISSCREPAYDIYTDIGWWWQFCKVLPYWLYQVTSYDRATDLRDKAHALLGILGRFMQSSRRSRPRSTNPSRASSSSTRRHGYFEPPSLGV
ncbi:hypothetical protein B0T25DRAFT_279115 [Lasiosphaeria hispida]|uniref:Uncharacterized protein n=1 Tax=Lasiosphaeria hispida TaxID=260671 RepID=A0AAJ0HBD2_9PEZI|nr:hypothetical protein B0T25DRAFT_279115 [Lasiosphaeria hispida]